MRCLLPLSWKNALDRNLRRIKYWLHKSTTHPRQNKRTRAHRALPQKSRQGNRKSHKRNIPSNRRRRRPTYKSLSKRITRRRRHPCKQESSTQNQKRRRRVSLNLQSRSYGHTLKVSRPHSHRHDIPSRKR